MTTLGKVLMGIALVLGVLGFVMNFTGTPRFASQSFGALGLKLAENYDPYIRYNGGYYSLLPIQTTGALSTGGPFTVTTSNSATSTTAVGCIQTTATSTATPIRLVIGSTLQASTTFQGTNSNFSVFAQYGTCPI